MSVYLEELLDIFNCYSSLILSFPFIFCSPSNLYDMELYKTSQAFCRVSECFISSHYSPDRVPEESSEEKHSTLSFVYRYFLAIYQGNSRKLDDEGWRISDN